MNDNLKMGTLLFRSKGVVEHVGVYVGFGRVIHTIPETGVNVVSIDEFGDGKSIRVVDVDDIDSATLSSRINEVLSGDITYSLSKRNCQHVANYIISGNKKSPQLRWSITSAIIAGCYAIHRGVNPAPYIAIGGLIGCLAYSTSISTKSIIETDKMVFC